MERQDEAWCSCSPRQCRICHEDEEDEGCATATAAAMESPCGCSGSLKVYMDFLAVALLNSLGIPLLPIGAVS